MKRLCWDASAGKGFVRGLRRLRSTSEGESYGEMQCKVTSEIGMDEREAFAARVDGGIDGLHAAVEAQHEVTQVQSQTQSVGYGNLLVERAEAEQATGLVGVVAGIPYVTGVDEEGTMEFGEKLGTQFHAQVQLHISHLVDEVDFSVLAHVAAGAEFPCAPSAHTVGAAREVAFFIRHHAGVPIGYGNAEGGVYGQGVTVVQQETFGKVEVELGILRIGDVEDIILPVLVLFRMRQV